MKAKSRKVACRQARKWGRVAMLVLNGVARAQAAENTQHGRHRRGETGSHGAERWLVARKAC